MAAALRSPAFYVGALGSARTHARRLARLAGLGFSEAELAQNSWPGRPCHRRAQSPAEIAIAILAELVQLRRAHGAAPRIAGIVLAAGTVQPHGHATSCPPKLRGKPLVRHAVEAALAAGLDPVIVVTGHEAGGGRQGPGRACTSPLSIIRDFADGLSTSLRPGIEAVPGDCDGAMVLLGDMPGITAGSDRPQS